VSGRAPDRDGYAYPLYRENQRQLPPGWDGTIYIWDIDNTYLITEWDGFRDLIRIRFEAAEDKRPVPGAVELLAGLRRVEVQGERPPVYFVSASPETMRPVLERRMLIDGVVHDGITFRSLRRLRYLRDIFGYKLAALLLYRLENPPGAREVLFGDDREHDPWIYELYARACAGTCRGAVLETALAGYGVRASAARYIASLAAELPERDPVTWILIRRTGAARVERDPPDDPRLVLLDDFAQGAALLRALGLMPADDLRRVRAAVRAAGSEADPLRAVRERSARLPAGALAALEAELEEEGA
jgi:hypothetical protein